RAVAPLLLELDADDGDDRAVDARADQRAAEHVGVRVEDALARDREERLATGDHPLALAAAEPDAARWVAVAEIAHPMAEARSLVLDLRERGLLLGLEVAAGG